MAEKDFEVKAKELREARDMYMEGEEGGVEGVGIVPGASGARQARGRRLENEVKDQRDLLKGLREEVQELRKVVSVVRGGFIEVAEAFTDFRKEFLSFRKEVVQAGKEFQAFHKGFSEVVKDFGLVVEEFKRFQSAFSEVGKELRSEFGKLSEWMGGLGKLSEKVMKEYKVGAGKVSRIRYDLEKDYMRVMKSDIEKMSRFRYDLEKEYRKVREGGMDVERVIRKARMQARARSVEKGYDYGYDVIGRGRFGYDYGYGVRRKDKFGYGMRGKGKWLGYGYGYGFRDVLATEEMGKQLSVREQLKKVIGRSILGVIFGEVGRGRYGRWGSGRGELVGNVRDILFSSLGPIGVFVSEWLSGAYGKWEEWREAKRQLEERRRGELMSRGVGKVRQIRGRKERGRTVSELMDWVKELVWGKRMGGGGVVLSAVGGGGVGLGRVGKVSLSDVELVQERNARIYTNKLHIQAKEVSGVGGGGGGLFDVLSGGGLLGRLGRWAGRIGLGIGAGLAFLGGVQEGGIVRGIFSGLGALGGGVGGMKLGALIGTMIAPGVGTAVGSVLGGVLGMFGGEKIADAVYSGMKRLVKDRDWVESLGKGFEGVVDRIGNFLKGVIEGVKSGVSVVSGVAGRALGWVKEKIRDLDLGVVSRIFEVGEAKAAELPKAAGVVANTKGDIGGMSAGMYQFTKEAQLKFLKEYGYMKEFEGVPFGTAEWKKRWQEVAKKYGEKFARDQQEFAMREYFVPGVRVAERFGIDVRGSRALQEMIFARVVQQGVGGLERLLRNVFRGMTVEQVKAMSPQEIVTRVYDHLIANVDKYWARSSLQVREGMKRRLMKEKELLLEIEKQKKEVQRRAGDVTQKKRLKGDYREERKEERGRVKDMGERRGRELGEGEGLTFYEGVRRGYGRDVWGIGRQGFIEEGSRMWWGDFLDVRGDWRLISDRLRKLYEGIGRWRELDFSDFGLGGEVDRMKILSSGGDMWGIDTVITGEPYLVSDGGVIDADVGREQREVRRRVIDVDVRKEMEVMSSVGEVMEKVLSSVAGKTGGGSTGKVVLPGGDAFSKVPLFPEDVGLVMMMLGLV